MVSFETTLWFAFFLILRMRVPLAIGSQFQSNNTIMCRENSYLLPNNFDPLKGTKTEKKLTSGAPHAYTVVYNSESHWEVLTQTLGSVWPNVIPYCLLNVVLMVILRMLRDHTGNYGYIITMFFDMGSSGRKFMNFVMAFLVVTRVKMSLDRYNEARSNIGILYRESREVIQNSVIFTSGQRDDNAREWRLEVAYRTLLLLRSAMAVLNFSVREVSVWNLPELNGKEKEHVLRNLLIHPENQHYGIDPNTEFEENLRIPNLVAYMLTESIVGQSARLKQELPVPQEMKLMGSVDAFMGGYYGLRKFLTTPTPFPLIQLTTTFTFFYVFTIPYVLLGDDSGLVAHMFFTFLITMGFIGLNAVAIELDNPFGDDPNDFK